MEHYEEILDSVISSCKAGDEVTISSDVIRKGRKLSFIDSKATVGEKIIATAKVTKSILSS